MSWEMIVEQRVDEKGIYVRLSDGREYIFTKESARAKYQEEFGRGRGSVTSKANTVNHLKSELSRVLGIAPEFIGFNLDTRDGTPTYLKFGYTPIREDNLP